MKEVIFYLILPFFLFFNYRIIVSDAKKKIIPNKYLLGLLVLSIFSFFITPFTLFSFLYLLIWLFISFWFYYFGFWAAWDSKYIIVLSLFLPFFSFHYLLWNLWIAILLYFVFSTIYHLFVNYSEIFSSLKNKLYSDYQKFKLAKKDSLKVELIKFFMSFFAFFITLRLFRDNLIFFIEWESIFGIPLMWFNLMIGLFAIIISATLVLMFTVKYLRKKVLNVVHDHKFKIDPEVFFFSLISSLFVYFLYLEYRLYWNEIFDKLFVILTLYLLIFLLVKWFYVLIKHIYVDMEYEKTWVFDLKPGDIIDKKEVRNYIYYAPENEKSMIKKERDKALSMIDSVLDVDSVEILRNLITDINQSYIDFNSDDEITHLGKLKTFAFALYIFIAFVFTYFYSDILFKIIADIIKTALNMF